MRKLISLTLRLALATLSIPAPHPAIAAGSSVGCASDQAITACVVSASLSGARWQGEPDSMKGVTVSVTLRVENTGDFPTELAIKQSGGSWGTFSFSPKNAEGIPNEGQWNLTGLQMCSEVTRCELTTLSPHSSLIAQIRYRGQVSTSGLPLIEIASVASFSTTIIVVDRGKPRLVSLALTDFPFGNAIPNLPAR